MSHNKTTSLQVLCSVIDFIHNLFPGLGKIYRFRFAMKILKSIKEENIFSQTESRGFITHMTLASQKTVFVKIIKL